MLFKLKRLKENNSKEVVELLKEYRETTFSEEKIKEILKNYPSVGAYNNEKLIGFCYTTTFSPDILEIYNLFISKQYRNFNIGSKLLEEITVQAKLNNYKGMILSNSLLYKTKEPKLKAKVFYERNGFKLVLTTGNTDIFVKNI